MTKETLQNIFRKPFSMEVWQELLRELFSADSVRITPQIIDNDNNNVLKSEFLGELNTHNDYKIGLFSFEVKENTKIGINRVGLRKLVHNYTCYKYDAVIAIFYNDTQWRLSFISDLTDESTAPKRYTYVFGNETENYRTASEQLIKLYNTRPTFESIKEVFSVEKLSEEFFAGYEKQYLKFVKYIIESKQNLNEKQNRDYVKKMMGRLVFLQFLQKRGWLGVPADNKDWIGGDLQYTQNLIKRYEGNDKLLTNVLEVLFFDTLNSKRTDDLADPKLGDNIKIPYLNGGLFDKDILDKKDIDFPYSYFADLMEFFSHYNFTIDENDPYDAEVGIDPEMLGHIFEHLLEDNKSKGIYYTPKEIVQYMCRQSLIEYLQSKLGKHETITTLVNQHDRGEVMDKSNFVAQNAATISKLLDEVKICDPAIGSGAFPMGILNEIFHIKLTLNTELNEKRAEVKKSIIQNSIYGVDIEQGAVDIARLRFWLSLVVDENRPQPLPNLDYKIMCGNSLLSRHALDTPFNEAFAEYNKGKKKDEQFTLESYKALVANYTNNSNKEEKAAFTTKIEEIKRAFKTELDKSVKNKRIKLEREIFNLTSTTLLGEPSKEDIKLAKEKKEKVKIIHQKEKDISNNNLYTDAFEWRYEFPALLDDSGKFMGFDIVIGNPPYVTESLPKTISNNYSTSSSKELYAFFFERAIKDLLHENGVIAFITGSLYIKGLKYKTLREFLVNNITKPTLTIAGDDVFKNVNMPTSILIALKQKINNWSFDEFLPNNNLLCKLENNTTTIKTFTKIQRGFEIGKNQTTFDLNGINFITGEDIGRFSINKIRKISQETFKNYKKSDFYYSGDRILIRETGRVLTSVFLDYVLYSNRSLYSIKLAENIDIQIKYLLAIMNSRLMQYYYYAKYKSDTDIFPKIRIAQVKELPIKIISADKQQPYINLTNQILELKRENPKADTSALEAEIDKMVYALYDLTKEEVEVIEKN